MDWQRPQQLNGELERYLVYVSTNQSSVGDVAYNDTIHVLYEILTDLTPGTLYYISVAVSSLVVIEALE